MAKGTTPESEPDPESKGYVNRSINIPSQLDERIDRCMKLEGLRVFTEWANSAFTRRCREIEREHEIDAKGNSVSK